MTKLRVVGGSRRGRLPVAVVAAALTGALSFLSLGQARADPAPRPRVAPHRALHRTAAARPLTIRKTALRRSPVVVRREAEPIDRDFVFRDWNDTRLGRLGPFRLGGNVFYGDTRGDPIDYGNAGLAQIAGYGPANGGFGGPHFDSVGGFHPGPGPDAQEDDDYASGSISTPIIDGPVPHYPSVKARVAALNQGVVPARGSFALPERGARADTRAAALPRPTLAPDADDDDDAPSRGRAATPDDMFPGLDLGGDLF